MSSEKKNPPALPPESRLPKNSRFQPGLSGNPGGRPRTAHISEALRDELDCLAPDGEATNAQAIARRLVKTARDAKRDSQATQAAEVIADRIEGKPMQALSVETHMDESTAKRIAALYAWLVLGQQEMLNSFPCPTPENPGRALPDVSQATILDGQVALSESSTATTTATETPRSSGDM